MRVHTRRFVGSALRGGVRAGIGGVLALTIAGGAGCGRTGHSAVAEVDDEEIAVVELRRALDARVEADPGAPAADLLTEELDRLVNQRVALNRAQELGIAVSDAEVDTRIRLVHGDDFEAVDARYREEIRNQMRIDRAAIRELTPGLRIPESALAAYFESHREEFSHPDRIQIRQIVVEERDRAERLLKILRDDGDFEQLARENSLAPEAEQGGLLPPFEQGELPEVFDRAFEVKPGQLSDVIESPHGYHIFSVIERIPAQEQELADVREELTMRIAQDQISELRPQWLRDLRRSADIRVHERLLETLKR